MKKLTVYFDMDGVLADFDKNVNKLKQYDPCPWLNSKKFFENLEVIGNPNETIKLLQALGHEVFLLSKVEVRDGLDRAYDKKSWVRKNLPSIANENIIIVPIHHNKYDYIKSDITRSVLVDDYKGNLLEWQAQGGISVKFGNKLKTTRPYYQIASDIAEIVPLLHQLGKE